MNPWKQIQDKAKNGRITPSNNVWNIIEQQLNSQTQIEHKKRLIRSIGIAAAIAILFSIGTFYILESVPGFQVEPLVSEHLPTNDASDQWIYLYSDLHLDFHEKGKLVPNFKKRSEERIGRASCRERV